MFLTTALKDYVDQLNDLSLSLTDNFTLFTLFKYSLLYILDSVKFVFVYILSFQWLTDFVELPCNFKANYSAIFDGKSVLTSILETKIGPNFFAFTNGKLLNENNFGTGLLNSFFLALPLSVPHLLTIRAFLLNGVPAAMYAAAGTILGQFFFLTCVLFGFEWVLIPFLSFEPFNYLIGLIVIVNLLYTMTHKPVIYTLNKTQQDILFPLFGINFFLAWTEQTSIFQYFGNLTFNSFPTLLQNNFNSILPNLFYLSGILIGTIAWTVLFGALIMAIRNWVAAIFSIPFTFLTEKIHYGTLFITFVFCLTSIPYYGFDYLMSNPLGFLSQDKSLTWTKPEPVKVIRSPEGAVFRALSMNVAPFDQKDLLKNDAFGYFYEDLSFQPLHYWNNRRVIREPLVLKLNQLKQKTTATNISAVEDARRNFVLDFYKPEQIDQISSEPDNILEKNVDTIAKVVFTPSADAYNYFGRGSEERPEPSQLEQFRKKYHSNPLYKALTQLEINSFLLGQPNYQNLTASDEVELYKRRVIFERYLDSIDQYKSIGTPKTKAFAEKVYNQQFKGTLDLVRQFFSIELSDSKTPSLDQTKSNETTILKYDQPLYNEVIRDFNPLLHEELSSQLSSQRPTKLARVDSTPFYIGWDSGLRKFLVKTNCIPGVPNGTTIVPSKSKFDSGSIVSPLTNPDYFSFQSWPKTHESFEPNSNLSIPYTEVSEETKAKIATLFNLRDSASNVSKKEGSLNRALESKNLPSYNWSNINTSSELVTEMKGLGNSIPPEFGGITWPGINAQTVFDKFNYLKKLQIKS